MEPSTALAYATEAVRCFVQKGWLFDSNLLTKVKLIHPHGPDNFHHIGVVFIDIFGHKWARTDQYIRLCVLFPQQQMPLHHHKLRKETFTVVKGLVILHEDSESGMRHTTLRPGETMSPEIETLHGVETDLVGGAYVGVCHKDHLRDVHWQDTAEMADERLTMIDLTRIPYLPCAVRDDFTAKGVPSHVHWESLISDMIEKI
jgi:quercetin dioxygenase-like cupin family protein